MDILLTGATGFIGNHLRTYLHHAHRLFAVTREHPLPQEEGLAWLSGDLSDPDVSNHMPKKMDAVIYLAQSRAYRHFPEQAEDIFNVNVLGTMKFLDYARRAGAHTFIFTSTANVYRQSNRRISEGFIVEPHSFYANTKRMAEMLVESYAKYFNCVVLRLFTVYGPGQTAMLIPNLVERILNKQHLQVQGKHGFKTSPIYVDDLKMIIEKFLEHKTPHPDFSVFNVGGDESFGIHELGLIIGKALDIVPQFDYLPGDEALGWIANNSKLKARLKLNSLTPFVDGIRQTIGRA